MNDKLVFGQYYNTNSVIHRLDPRLKLFCLIIMMIVTFLIPFNDFILLGGLYFIILIIIILTKVPIFKYLNSLKQIAFLLIFSFIFQIFTGTDGKLLMEINCIFNWLNILIVIGVFVLYFLIRKFLHLKLLTFILTLGICIYIFTFSFGISSFTSLNLKIFEGGVKSGTFIIGRVLMIILVSTTLTLTTKPMDLSYGLEWYLKPLELLKIKTSILAMMISIALRFIPTLFNETNKILKAQASRGVDFKEGKLHEQVKQIISLLIPMFVISFKRAVDLADAMEARGYVPGAKRTKLLKLKFKLIDYICFFIIISIFLFVIIWRIKYAL